ncbi:MAG: transposase [Bacteroidetes bacterium]|nr:transposase [Bacteroidota bacterium]
MAEYAWENGMAERLNGVIKNNYLQYRKCKSFTELAKEVDRSVLLYNYEKPHKMLQKKSPMQFEKLILPLVRQTPQKMTKSLDAAQRDGTSSPIPLMTNPTKESECISANILF